MSLTRRDIYLALAKNVPDPDGGSNLVANMYRTWKTRPATRSPSC